MHVTAWEKKGVVISYSGTVTSGEMSLAAAQVQASAKFDQMQYAIHDLTACESLTTVEMELTTMVARASVAVERTRTLSVAFVGTNLTLFQAFRHFKSVGIYERDLRIFTSLREARNHIARITGIDT